MPNANCERRVNYPIAPLGEPLCDRDMYSCIFPKLSSEECPVFAYFKGEIDIAEHNRRIPEAHELNTARASTVELTR